MNTNYDLKKALYNFLDVKLDSSNQIVINNTDKNIFKMIKVEAGSIVNIFVSGQSYTVTEVEGGDVVDNNDSSSANTIAINGFSKNKVNDYYSDFLIKVFWDDNNNIYIMNTDDNSDVNIRVNSIHVEFLKGKLETTYLEADNTSILEEYLKITIDSDNVNRINYKNETLTFQSEHEMLVDSLENFKTNYETWRNTLGHFSMVDGLIPDTATETGKNKHIGDYISDGSINTDLLIDNNITIFKLSPDVQGSLNLADSAIQDIKINGDSVKDENNIADIKALTGLKILDYNATGNGDNIYREPYEVNELGIITINDWHEYIQPKLTGDTDDLLYFENNDVLSSIGKDIFLLKNNILKSTDDWEDANDVKVPSSLIVKTALADKIDKINKDSEVTELSLLKVTISDQGLITSQELVDQDDLTGIIKDYYLTVSYEFNEETGELKLL